MVKVKIVFVSEGLRTGPDEREANVTERGVKINFLDPETGEVLMSVERLKAEG